MYQTSKFFGIGLVVLAISFCGTEPGTPSSSLNPLIDNHTPTNNERLEKIFTAVTAQVAHDDETSIDLALSIEDETLLEYFIIERSTDQGNTFEIITNNFTSNQYRDLNLNAGTYQYQVTAYFKGDVSHTQLTAPLTLKPESTPITPIQKDPLPFDVPSSNVTFVPLDNFNLYLETTFEDTTYLKKATLTIKHNDGPSSVNNQDQAIDITKDSLGPNRTWQTKNISIPNAGSYTFTVTAAYNYYGQIYIKTTDIKESFPKNFVADTRFTPALNAGNTTETPAGQSVLKMSHNLGRTVILPFQYFRIERKITGQQDSQYELIEKIDPRTSELIKILAPEPHPEPDFFRYVSYQFEETALNKNTYTYRVFSIYTKPNDDNLYISLPSEPISVIVK